MFGVLLYHPVYRLGQGDVLAQISRIVQHLGQLRGESFVPHRVFHLPPLPAGILSNRTLAYGEALHEGAVHPYQQLTLYLTRSVEAVQLVVEHFVCLAEKLHIHFREAFRDGTVRNPFPKRVVEQGAEGAALEHLLQFALAQPLAADQPIKQQVEKALPLQFLGVAVHFRGFREPCQHLSGEKADEVGRMAFQFIKMHNVSVFV